VTSGAAPDHALVVDRRFMCQDCGTKWFIPEHRVSEPDLTECDACGGPLAKLAGYPGNDGYDSRPGTGADESEG
jgi:hypothetical protein